MQHPLPTPIPAPYRYPGPPLPPANSHKKWLLIVLACMALLMLPIIAILAAIAIPAYHDYTLRAKISAVIGATIPYKVEISEHAFERESQDCLQQSQLPDTTLPGAKLNWAGAYQDDACGFEISLDLPKVESKTIEFHFDQQSSRWDCTGGTLEARYRPAGCRA